MSAVNRNTVWLAIVLIWTVIWLGLAVAMVIVT